MEKTENIQSEMKTGFAAIRRHLKPFHHTLWWMTVLGIISAIANGAVPYVTGKFFDSLIDLSKHQVAEGLPLWGFLLLFWVIFQLIANNIDWIRARMQDQMTTRLEMQIEYDGFAHFFHLPLSYHKNAHVNGELQKVARAGWQISSIVGTVANLSSQFLSVIIGFFLALSINSTLALILILGVSLYILALVRILKRAGEINSLAHKKWNESWDNAAQAVQQVESVKQSVAENYELDKLHANLLGKGMELWNQKEKIWSNVGFFQRTIVFLTQLAVFLFSIHFIATGMITVGELIAVNGYAMMFFGPFVSLGYNWQTIQDGFTTAAHAEEIFKKPTETYKPEHAEKKETVTGEISFDHVTFAYEKDQTPILSDINLKISSGEIIAFVGESGVGKSTIVSLVSGYHFSISGNVFIDGIDTKKWNLTDLRAHIAVVPQELALFNSSIKANIAYGSFGATDEQIQSAAREAHIDTFIESLPEKYESLVGERGIKLSVGQKQRVAIARAILRNPAILILDEPTSALDAQTEKAVTEELEKLMRGRTTLIIAHRLSTVRKADKIVVLEKGKIAEIGTHTELIQKENGVYRKLYEYQVGLHE